MLWILEDTSSFLLEKVEQKHLSRGRLSLLSWEVKVLAYYGTPVTCLSHIHLWTCVLLTHQDARVLTVSITRKYNGRCLDTQTSAGGFFFSYFRGCPQTVKCMLGISLLLLALFLFSIHSQLLFDTIFGCILICLISSGFAGLAICDSIRNLFSLPFNRKGASVPCCCKIFSRNIQVI